jgi:PAS domain S-box-containing protein
MADEAAPHAQTHAQAEAALLQSREQLRLIVENARDHAIFVLDSEGTIVDWGEGAAVVFGYGAAEIVGRDVALLFVPEDRAQGAPEQERADARENGKAPDVRWHLRKDGKRVFMHGIVTALHGPDGAVTGFLKIAQDVTERHAAEQRQKILLAELQHRVRNSLAVVRSIVRRTAQNSDTVEDMCAHLQGRIDSFARVQAVVARDVESGVDLGSLIADELLAHATVEGKRLRIEGPDLLLASKPAETLSLAVHELTTNAVKYGALGTRDGTIRVHWSRRGEGGAERLEFVWEERGRDRPLVAVGRSGFGFELLQRTLPYELDAETEIEFLGEGLRFTLRMPLAGKIAAARGPAEDRPNDMAAGGTLV